VLVNVARGEVVYEAALMRTLKDKIIGGAILDTFSREPLPKDSALWNLPNTVITPHVACRSASFTLEETDLFLDNFGRFARRESLRNVVDPEAGY
jgi:phosphoglycerate dehydrogenase-like enzyme